MTANGRAVSTLGGERFYFDRPDGAEYFRVLYQGEKGHRMTFRNGEGEVVYDKISIAESGRTTAALEVTGSRKGWSFWQGDDLCGGKCMLRVEEIRPVSARKALWLSVSPEKFFWPSEDEVEWE